MTNHGVAMLVIFLFQNNQQQTANVVQDVEELVEGDIYGIPSYVEELNRTLSNNSGTFEENAPTRSIFVPLRWPSGPIPYHISSDFTTTEQEIILAMMDKIEDLTCVTFKPKENQATYIDILRRTDFKPCKSFIGYENSGPREMYLQKDCLNRNGVLHELMHALGFFHEHNRHDRDNYVRINFDNVKESGVKNFQKRPFLDHVYVGLGYDFNSVTHYPTFAFSKSEASPTIIPKFGHKIEIKTLSKRDVMKIKRFYLCDTTVDEYSVDDISTHRSNSSSSTQTYYNLQSVTNDAASIICPNSWIYDENNPHICYKQISYLIARSWRQSMEKCTQLHPKASLPIFHELAEYVSYKSLWDKIHPCRCCSNDKSWLGITFSKSIHDYCWTDGKNVTFSLLKYNEPPEESSTHFHYFSNLNWNTIDKNNKDVLTVCQLRLSNDPVNDSALYSKNSFCPKQINWYYDEDSEICYYYGSQKLTWPSAYHHCKTKVNGSLPYFATKQEFESFVKLVRRVVINCNDTYWLGYYDRNGEFTTTNGSKPAFLHWSTRVGFWSDYIKHPSPQQSYVRFHVTMPNAWDHIPEDNFHKFFCQCRYGKCDAQITNSVFQIGKKGYHKYHYLFGHQGACPYSWTVDETYPNICYKSSVLTGYRESLSWRYSNEECIELHPNATLPIFRNLDEYKSYTRFWYQHSSRSTRFACTHRAWLGVKYNTNSKNYSWIDGTNLTFS